MIRGNNDGKATDPSLSSSAQPPPPPPQFLPVQSLQAPIRLPQQQQQQQIVHLGSAQQVVRPLSVAAIATTASTPSQTVPSVVQNVNVVAIQTSPSTIAVVSGATPTLTTACIGQSAQSSLSVTPAAVQQYVLTGSHQVTTATPTLSTVPSKLQPSALCAVVTSSGSATPAGVQQTLYTVGSSSSLARILASTQGYIHVRYENPITAVATGTSATSSGSSASGSPNVLRTVAPPAAVTLASIPSYTTSAETSGATIHHLAASTTETWARPNTPATGLAVKMAPQVLTYQQEGSTDRVISRPSDPTHLHSYTDPGGPLSTTPSPFPHRTIPAAVQEHVAGLIASPPPPPAPSVSQQSELHEAAQTRSLNPATVAPHSTGDHVRANVAPRLTD